MRHALAALAVFCAGSVAALDSSRNPTQLIHRSWSRAEGMPVDAAWAVHQAANGYLWIGTEGGLVRFDGVEFEVFSGRHYPAFRSDDVRDIAEAPDGTIWAATFGGGLLRVRGHEVTAYDRTSGMNNDVVYAVHVATNGDLWAGTANGVCRLRGEAFTCWESATTENLVQGRIVRLAEDDEGVLWFASLVDGLSSFDGKRFARFDRQDGLVSPQIFMVMNDPTYGVFLGTYAGDYHHAVPGGLAPIERGDLPEGLTPLAAVRDQDSNLWIGMNSGGGLWRMRPDAQRLDNPEEDISHIFGLTEDTEGGLWAATSGGIHQYRAGPFVPWGKPEGMADATFVVVAAHDGGVWVGTEGTGLYHVAANGGIRRLTTADGLPLDSVSSLMLDADGTLWAGTFGGGLATLQEGKVTRVITTDDGLAGNQITSLFRSDDGALWIGTAGGLNRFVDHVVTDTITVNEGLLANLVRHIETDVDGNLLLSTDSGLMRLSPDTFDILDVYTSSDGLAVDVVATTFTDSAGVTWVGGRNGGLARLEGDALFRYDSSHRLGIDSIMTIVEDHEGHLWFGGRRGITCVAKTELNAIANGEAARVNARVFGEADGLRSVRVPGGFQSPAALTRDGRLWFATARGLAVVDPRELPSVDEPLEVLIEGIRVDGQQLTGGPTYRIPAGAKSVQIEYSVPHLTGGDTLRFRYRMVGDGDRWHDAGKRRTAFFTSLPPRRNLFEVDVARLGQPWSHGGRQTTMVKLYVEPKWFETYLFRSMAALLLLLLMLGGYRIALSRYRRRQKRLERLVGERTVALRDALQKVEKMSRTDTLTGVANRRHFDERLRDDWARAVKERLPISVMMVDIDYFKQFNDVAGHQAGDRCLADVAQALAGSVREQDFVARYGGEEFAVLLTGSDVPATRAIGKRLQQSVRALQMTHPGRPDGAMVTVSAGFATAQPGIIESARELLRRADAALYRAKAGGRDCIVVDGMAKTA